MKKFVLLAIVSLLASTVSVSYGEEAKRPCTKKNCDCRCNTDNNGAFVLDKDNVVFSKFMGDGLANIIRTNKKTQVVLTVRSIHHNGWVFFSENTFLRDCQTGICTK